MRRKEQGAATEKPSGGRRDAYPFLGRDKPAGEGPQTFFLGSALLRGLTGQASPPQRKRGLSCQSLTH